MTAWLGVVAADHVRRAVALGIAQIGHGQKSGLARMRAGDQLVYYSPRDTLGGAVLQEFTAIGRVAYDTSATPVPLDAVRGDLELTAGPNWGYQLRRGLVELSDADAACLAAATGAPR